MPKKKKKKAKKNTAISIRLSHINNTNFLLKSYPFKQQFKAKVVKEILQESLAHHQKILTP